MLKIVRRTVPLEMEGTINRLNSDVETEKAKNAEYERSLAEISENTIAKANHDVGEYITLNGMFCEVIEKIFVGETIAFDRDVKAVSIGAVLSGLKGE